MTQIFRYSVIRFRPYAETGEFANIGILIVSLSSGELGFELAPKRFPRVRGFFDAAVHEAYGSAISSLQLELARATEYLPANYGNEGDAIFESITERRESSVIFSESRVIEGQGLQLTLDRLFTRLVKREFATADTAEVVLTRDIRLALRRYGMRQFKAIRLHDDVVPVVFPLAYKGTALRAIKPLAFSQKNPLSVFDYGAHWKRRIEYLLEKRKVLEGNVFLAIEPPPAGSDHRMGEAFVTAMNELRSLPFPVEIGESAGRVNPKIIDFAQESVPYGSQLLQ